MKISEMLFANAMMGEGGGGGGGGGDFKTAQVTVMLEEGNASGGIYPSELYSVTDEAYYDCVALTEVGFESFVVVLDNEPVRNITVIMNEDTVHMYCTGYSSSTGGVSFDAETGYVLVTGDGTITVVSGD